MRITFFTFFVSDVSKDLYEALHDKFGDSFNVICVYDGAFYSSFNKNVNRVLYYNDYIIDFHNENAKAINVIENSDVIFYSNMPYRIARKYNKKALLIKISERIYKNPLTIKSFVHTFLSRLKQDVNWFWRPKTYLLAIGGYTYGDYMLFGTYKNRAYRYAYLGFYDNKVLIEDYYLKHKNTTKKLLWIGSMDYDKKLDILLMTLKRIYKEGINNFVLTIVGDGKLKKNYEKYVNDNSLSKYVSFVGNVSFDDCMQYIKESNYYLATGGREEGYNCSILKAFNYGTICIANISCGSTIDLINDETTGYIFDSYESLYSILKKLLHQYDISVVNNSFDILKKQWNKQIVCERIIPFIVSLCKNGKPLYEDGVFSKCTIKKHYFKKYEVE